MKNYQEEESNVLNEKEAREVEQRGYMERIREMEAEKMRNAAWGVMHRTPGVVMGTLPAENRNGPVYPVPRNDGKQICSKLRKARERLARANSIPFVAVPCRQEQACGGCCPTCDAEVEYLERELAKIPEYRREYPKLELEETE